MPPSKKTTISSSSAEAEPPDDIVAMVTSMGFTREQAVRALKATVSTSLVPRLSSRKGRGGGDAESLVSAE